MKIRRFNWLISIFSAGVVVLGPGPAWAVQTHGGPEGLVAHQFGHVLFAAGMISLLGIGSRARWSGAGWSRFKAFLWLIVLWNGITFTGHLLDQAIDPGQFVREGGQILQFEAAGLVDWMYYLTRLDHVVLIPALFFLLAALRLWSRSGEDVS